MKISPKVRHRLEQLADYVEAHGSGAMRALNEYTPLTLSLAHYYANYYEGYKRETQELAIESGLMEPDDPFYGWGDLAGHEVSVYDIGANKLLPIQEIGKAYTEEEKLQRKTQLAEIRVIRQNRPIPTVPMCLQYATIKPIVILGLRPETFYSRLNRLRKQVESIGLLEKLGQLSYIITPEGLKVGIFHQDQSMIGPIDKNNSKPC